MARQGRDEEAGATSIPPVTVGDGVLATYPGRAALVAGLKAGLVVGLVAAAPQLLQLLEPLLALPLSCCIPLPAALGSGILAAHWLRVPRQAERPDALLAPYARVADTDLAALAGAVAGTAVATMHTIVLLLIGFLGPRLLADWSPMLESAPVPLAMVPLAVSFAPGAAGGMVSAAVRKGRTSPAPGLKKKPLSIPERPAMIVGRGLVTVTGGGMAAVAGSTVTWYLLDVLSGLGYTLVSHHMPSVPYDVWYADFTGLLGGTLVGLLAVNALFGALLWRAAQKQDEGMRSGVLGKANCTIALIGSVGMTVILGLGSAVALQVSLNFSISGAYLVFSIPVALCGAFAGVLVGVTVGALVRAVLSSGAGKLGREEAGVLSSVDAVLSVLSIILFLALICFWIANIRFTTSGVTSLGYAYPAGGLISLAIALLFRGLAGWTAPESHGRGE